MFSNSTIASVIRTTSGYDNFELCSTNNEEEVSYLFVFVYICKQFQYKIKVRQRLPRDCHLCGGYLLAFKFPQRPRIHCFLHYWNSLY